VSESDRAMSGQDEESLDDLRREIAAVDDDLVALIARRLELAHRIGDCKRRLGLPVLDPAREAEVVRRVAAEARAKGTDPELVRAVLWQIIDHARRVQSD
jgi:chorismate mutase